MPSMKPMSCMVDRAAETRTGSADRAFHLELDEAVQLHCVLERKLLRDRLDEAPDDHGGGLVLGDPPARQVEELLLADLRDRRLVPDVRVPLPDLDVGIGVR